MALGNGPEPLAPKLGVLNPDRHGEDSGQQECAPTVCHLSLNHFTQHPSTFAPDPEEAMNTCLK